MSRYRVSMDVGRTFTDVVAFDAASGTYAVAKAPTTPDDPLEGMLGALDQVLPPAADVAFAVHASAQGLDVLAQRRGARVLLLATEGVGDVYLIARGDRTRMFDLRYRKPEPLVPRADIVEIPGRLSAAGAEVEPLDEEAVRVAARRARDEGFGAIAVAFLFSYVDPAHELRAAEILREEAGDLLVVLSHRVAREWGEYERTSSTVMEAYTAPAVRAYLDRLDAELRDRALPAPAHVMRSSGGVATAAATRELTLPSLLAGPAGVVNGAVELARTLDRPNLVCVDMGGTSCDIALVLDGEPDLVHETSVDGLPLRLPTVDVRSAGAGGGAVACAEEGRLRVGPDGAGADPGPACYGRGGTQPTVTDANLVLGRIGDDGFAGGSISLDADAAQDAVAALGEQLGLESLAVAEGVCDVTDVQVALAIRTLAADRGVDLSDVALVACGGAGPLHAVGIARQLGIGEVLVPRLPGAFGASGMLETGVRWDGARHVFGMLLMLDAGQLADAAAELEDEGWAALEREGVDADAGLVEHALDLRYMADLREPLTVPLLGAGEPRDADFVERISDRFHAAHERRFGQSNPGIPVEVVAVRTVARGALGHIAPPPPAVADDVPPATRPVAFSRELRDTAVLRREALAPGATVAGPAVIAEATATTIVPPGAIATVHDLGTLLVSVGTES